MLAGVTKRFAQPPRMTVVDLVAARAVARGKQQERQSQIMETPLGGWRPRGVNALPCHDATPPT
jgi:hypothetical protein